MDSHPPKDMRACTSTVDRISFLPDSILESILSRLPIREAAATSILSSAWRNQWRCIPELVFDNKSYELAPPEVNTSELLLNIINIISLHHGPIKGLTFAIDIDETCPEVEQLMLFLCGKPVRELSFHFDMSSDYQIPSHLFSYEHLQLLSLSFCVFTTPPTFAGFHRLTCLKFFQVRFECDFHQNLISHCPLLERLRVNECQGIDTFVLDFPNLKWLELIGCSLLFFRFGICPLLATAVIAPSMEDDLTLEEVETCHLVKVFDCLPAVVKLEFGHEFVSAMTNAKHLKRFPKPIQSLRVLELYTFSFEVQSELSCILRLLMNAPNLQKLTIGLSEESKIDVLRFKAEDLLDYYRFRSDQLRVVEINYFYGTRTELEFIKLLLAASSSLEEIRITPFVEDPTTEQLAFLNQCPKVSPNVRIIFLPVYYSSWNRMHLNYI